MSVCHLYVCKAGTWAHTTNNAAWGLRVRTMIRKLAQSGIDPERRFIWELLTRLAGTMPPDIPTHPAVRQAMAWLDTHRPSFTAEEWDEINGEDMDNADDGPYQSMTAFDCAPIEELCSDKPNALLNDNAFAVFRKGHEI